MQQGTVDWAQGSGQRGASAGPRPLGSAARALTPGCNRAAWPGLGAAGGGRPAQDPRPAGSSTDLSCAEGSRPWRHTCPGPGACMWRTPRSGVESSGPGSCAASSWREQGTRLRDWPAPRGQRPERSRSPAGRPGGPSGEGATRPPPRPAPGQSGSSLGQDCEADGADGGSRGTDHTATARPLPQGAVALCSGRLATTGTAGPVLGPRWTWGLQGQGLKGQLQVAATWPVSGSLRTKATWGRPFHRKHPPPQGQNRPPVTSPLWGWGPALTVAAPALGHDL